MRHEPKLDLGIVEGREHPVIPFGDERTSDRAPLLGADGNVLEAGIARAQPSGRCDRLMERRVNASGFGIHEPGERVEVGALEFLELPVLKQEARQGMESGQGLQHLDIGGVAVLRAPPPRKLETLEQNFRDLAR